MSEKTPSLKVIPEAGSADHENDEFTKEILGDGLEKAQKLYNQKLKKLGSTRDEEFDIYKIRAGLQDDIAVAYKLSEEWPALVSDKVGDDRHERARFQWEFEKAFGGALMDNKGADPATIDEIFGIIHKYKK